MSEGSSGYLVGCMTLFWLACAATVVVGLLAVCFHIGAICWAERNLWHEAEKSRIAGFVREYEGKCTEEVQP